MSVQEVYDIQTYAYVLQPGDATEYRFMIHHYTGVNYRARPRTLPNYVSITITMSGLPNGFLDISKDELQDLRRFTISQAVIRSQLTNADFYTMAAVLLAASVLAFKPYDLERAEREMLKAVDYAKI